MQNWCWKIWLWPSIKYHNHLISSYIFLQKVTWSQEPLSLPPNDLLIIVLKAQWYSYPCVKGPVICQWHDTDVPINQLYSYTHKFIYPVIYTKAKNDYAYSKASHYFKIKIFSA